MPFSPRLAAAGFVGRTWLWALKLARVPRMSAKTKRMPEKPKQACLAFGANRNLAAI